MRKSEGERLLIACGYIHDKLTAGVKGLDKKVAAERLKYMLEKEIIHKRMEQSHIQQPADTNVERMEDGGLISCP